MSWLTHASQLGRLAAVLVALALSGLPRAVALAAPEEAHRCSCRAHAGEHECTCHKCAAIAARARRAAEEAAPPCHGPTGAAAPAPAERRAPDAPCFTGTCGAPEAPRPAVNGVELFTLPDGAPNPAPPPGAALRPALPGPQHQPRPPDPPPPRRADARARAALAAGSLAP